MENKMGTEKISRLVHTTGIPLMLSLLIMADRINTPFTNEHFAD